MYYFHKLYPSIRIKPEKYDACNVCIQYKLLASSKENDHEEIVYWEN